MSAVNSVQERPLSSGKKNHCSVFFNNHDGLKRDMNEDQKVSKDFLKDLEAELKSIGFGKISHFYNHLPSTNICDATFSSMVKDAEKIVVIFTSGFIENHWHKYSHQNCFKSLIDQKKSDHFLGIAVGLSKDEIPDELGLNNMILVHFEEEFKKDADKLSKWSKIRDFFLKEKATTRTRSTDQLTVQASDIDTDGLDDSNRGNGEGDVGSRNSNVVHREDTIMNVQETGDNLEVDGVNEVGEAADLNDSHSTVVHGIDDSPGAAAEVVNNSPGAVAVVSDHGIRIRANLSETSFDKKSLQDENKSCHNENNISIKSILNREEGSIRGVIFRAWTFWDWLKKNVNL